MNAEEYARVQSLRMTLKDDVERFVSAMDSLGESLKQIESVVTALNGLAVTCERAGERIADAVGDVGHILTEAGLIDTDGDDDGD